MHVRETVATKRSVGVVNSHYVNSGPIAVRAKSRER
jgi:hypothetical protein